MHNAGMEARNELLQWRLQDLQEQIDTLAVRRDELHRRLDEIRLHPRHADAERQRIHVDARGVRQERVGGGAGGQGVGGRSSLSSALRIDAATGLPPVSWISTVASRPTMDVGVRFQTRWIRLPPSPLGAIAAET